MITTARPYALCITWNILCYSNEWCLLRRQFETFYHVQSEFQASIMHLIRSIFICMDNPVSYNWLCRTKSNKTHFAPVLHSNKRKIAQISHFITKDVWTFYLFLGDLWFWDQYFGMVLLLLENLASLFWENYTVAWVKMVWSCIFFSLLIILYLFSFIIEIKLVNEWRAVKSH